MPTCRRPYPTGASLDIRIPRHASAAITQDIYQHVTPTMLEDAGARLSAVIGQHRVAGR